MAENVDRGKKFIDINGDLIIGTSDKIYTQAEYTTYGSTQYAAGSRSAKMSFGSPSSEFSLGAYSSLDYSKVLNGSASYFYMIKPGTNSANYDSLACVAGPLSVTSVSFTERYHPQSRNDPDFTTDPTTIWNLDGKPGGFVYYRFYTTNSSGLRICLYDGRVVFTNNWQDYTVQAGNPTVYRISGAGALQYTLNDTWGHVSQQSTILIAT